MVTMRKANSIGHATFHFSGRKLPSYTRSDCWPGSTRDPLNVLAAVGERGAGFKSLKDAWADTATAMAG